VKSTEDSVDGFWSSPERDRRNQRRVLPWALVWALSFIAVTLGITKGDWPFGMTLAGVAGHLVFGAATVLAYRRFLRETDELRRKIEVEALALAFGVGLVGGLSYWLLLVSGAAPVWGFALIFAAMMATYSAGVLIGHRRYS
jgi:hypothetical protein